MTLVSGPGDNRDAGGRYKARTGQSRHLLELERRVERLRERCERGRSYERSIAAANDALEAELEVAQAELARLDRRAAG